MSAHRIAMQFLAIQKTIAPAQLKRIKTLTGRKYRSEAVALGAQVLADAAPLARGELQKLKKKLDLVVQLQTLEGHMPESLGMYRRSLLGTLLEFAKESLPEDEYQAFAECF